MPLPRRRFDAAAYAAIVTTRYFAASAFTPPPFSLRHFITPLMPPPFSPPAAAASSFSLRFYAAAERLPHSHDTPPCRLIRTVTPLFAIFDYYFRHDVSLRRRRFRHAMLR
jgi:hypothetical protein